MSLKSIMQADLLTIQADLENPTFIYDSYEIPCSVGSPEAALALDEASGFTDIAAITFVVRQEDMVGITAPVAQRDKLTFRNIIYRVEKVTTNPNDAFIKITCTSANKMV